MTAETPDQITLTFEEPPQDPRGPLGIASHSAVAAQLRARPGEWAVVNVRPTAPGARSSAYQINSGRLAAFRPAGAFEAVSRTVNGEHRVYARYVGEQLADGVAAEGSAA